MQKMSPTESGRLGGKSTSQSKRIAALANGSRGGRPNIKLREFAQHLHHIIWNTHTTEHSKMCQIINEVNIVLFPKIAKSQTPELDTVKQIPKLESGRQAGLRHPALLPK